MDKVIYAWRTFFNPFFEITKLLIGFGIVVATIISIFLLSYIWSKELFFQMGIPLRPVKAEGMNTASTLGILLTVISLFIVAKYGIAEADQWWRLKRLPRLIVTLFAFALFFGTPPLLSGYWWGFPLGLVVALSIPPFLWDKLQKRYNLP